MTQPWGAKPEDWFNLDTVQGLGKDLLPLVCNPHATISPNSKMTKLGKTPSCYNREHQVRSFVGWTQKEATPDEIERWSRVEDYGICMQTRLVRAFDVDVLDPHVAEQIERTIHAAVPGMPVRRRADSSKRLLYFKLEGEFPKTTFKCVGGVVEFLGDAHQFCIAGTHEDGARYEVDGGLSQPIPFLTPEQFVAIWTDLIRTYATDEPVAEKRRLAHQATDPTAEFLTDNGWVLGKNRDGSLNIRCPFEQDHSEKSGDSSTTYFIAHTQGYDKGHFRCMHAHCLARSDQEFLDEIGFSDLAFDVITGEPTDALQHFLDRIDECDDRNVLYGTVADSIRDATLSLAERDMLASAFSARSKQIGYPISLQAARGAIKERKPSQYRLPEWLEPWVYVTDVDRFYRLDSTEILTLQGFNARFQRNLDKALDSNSAAQAAVSEYEIRCVERMVYAPMQGPTFIDEGGRHCANTFKPSSVPFAALAMSKEGLAAVELIERHVRLICGDRDDISEHLLRWIAHNVQFPGLKIRHAPLVRGVPGDGKSLIGTLITTVLGVENTRDVSPMELKSDFNAFTEGKLVAIFEELKSNSRYHDGAEIANKIKPWITNDRISVHRKRMDGYNVRNVTNYFAMTNFDDSLPLDDFDRRWFIIFTPWRRIGELAARVGDPALYFRRLFDALNTQAPQLRRWLLDYPLGDFDRHAPAPITMERASMVALSEWEGSESLYHIIQQGHPGVSSDVISVAHLNDAMSLVGEGMPHHRTVSKLLLEAGYMRYPSRISWQRSQQVVWVAARLRSLDKDGVLAKLDESILGGIL